ncbi:MAG: hypothetical protein ABJB22_07345 [Verrucomicrobiota bacterium]
MENELPNPGRLPVTSDLVGLCRALNQAQVVRVADEILVDIMTAACGVEFEEASEEIEWATFEGVPIPFATPELLLRLKQTVRESDVPDRIFLHRLLAERKSKSS